MLSIPDFVGRTLGLAAAKRGRELSRLSPQHDGERFRNVEPRPSEGIGKTLSIAWNALFNKPRGTVPVGALPVDALTRDQLDVEPSEAQRRVSESQRRVSGSSSHSVRPLTDNWLGFTDIRGAESVRRHRSPACSAPKGSLASLY